MSNPILSTLSHCGFGSKLLLMTAYMMEKAAVWPGECLQSIASLNMR